MRVFVAVLILIFGFQSWTRADDIRDFEIEGMSIGNSLLDYMNEDQIKNIKPIIYPKSKKFHDLPIRSEKFKDYVQVNVSLMNGDEKYIIYNIAGKLNYENNLESCLKKKKEIINQISSLFIEQKKKDYKHRYEIDDKKSFAEITDFEFENGSLIRIYCNYFSLESKRKRNFSDTLSVAATSKEYKYWLDNEAY